MAMMLNRARDLGLADLPLLGSPDRGLPFAWKDGRPIDRGGFIAAARDLAARLPDRPQVVNYCEDRYHFIVALAAAMMRGQITHLPHDRTPHALAHLTQKHPDIYCLVDTGMVPADLMCVAVDDRTPEILGAADIPAFPEDQIAAYVYTGGTTGAPSASVKTWGALVAGSWRIAKGIGLADHPDSMIIATVPAQHMYGLELSVLLPLTEGLTVHADRPLFPVDVERCAREADGDVVLVTTPVHLKALIAGEAKLPGLVKIISATAPLSRSLADRAELALDAPIVEIYGCSEAGSMASRRTIDGDRWRTLDGITLDCHDGRWFAHVPYLPAAVPLQDIIDLASPTEFELRGRTSEMVNVAGKRASLSGLNAILNDIPGVEDGVFCCLETGSDREIVRMSAFVVAPRLSAAQIRRRLRDKIDPVFMPRPLHLVDALPRTAAGKLTKSALEALARETRNERQ